jgi:hypothetical protein
MYDPGPVLCWAAMAEVENVRRDAAWIEREYGREKWPDVQRLIGEAIAAESPDPELSRVLGRVVRHERHSPDPRETQEAVFGGVHAQVPQSLAYGAQHMFVIDAVAHACTEATELVVELGAGWARYLFALWASGGPADATYVAAEYTEAGRRASELLASVAPRMSFLAVPFDYTRPELGGLPAAEEAVVFSASSVEQVPQVPAELFRSIASIAGRVTALHFEPVGWQLDGTPRRSSSRDYAERHDYSRNLVEAVRAAEAEGTVEIETTEPDVIGTNPENSVSLIVWRSKAR